MMNVLNITVVIYSTSVLCNMLPQSKMYSITLSDNDSKRFMSLWQTINTVLTCFRNIPVNTANRAKKWRRETIHFQSIRVRIGERDNLGRKIRYFYYIPVNYSWDILSIKLGEQTINAQNILSFVILLRNTKEKRI